MIENEITKTILARRSTRAYQTKEVEADKLDTLIQAAIWAPSGSNSQSWLFTVITSPEKLTELNELVRAGFLKWTPDDGYPAKNAAKKRAESESFNFYYRAPMLVIASNKADYANGIADCALGLENMFLAGESIGLGSCYINQLHWLENDEDIRQYLADLGIPKDHQICGSAVFGYIASPSKTPDRKPNTINIVK